MSKGFRQRVGLAQAILHKPKVLILDEPTNGLDPTQIVEVRNLIRKLSRHSTVMVSTHILSEVEATCDRAVIIMNGRLKADARLSDLAASNEALVTLDRVEDEKAVLDELQNLSGAAGAAVVSREEGRMAFRIHSGDGRDLCPAIYDLARNKDWSLCELKNKTRTLEAVFNRLTVDAGAGYQDQT